ncbi:MAG: hypothetical protein JWN04_1333, partial [Myxococcaceae bacterium]|nr:hypothetical protein [Myxococcaceae bacterium]
EKTSVRKSFLLAGVSVFAVVLACGDDGDSKDSSSTLATTCARACVRANAANCSNDVPADCMNHCMLISTGSPSACSSQANALLACAAKATFTCDPDDKTSTPVGCESLTTALGTCTGAHAIPSDSGIAVPPTPRVADAGRDASSPLIGHDGGGTTDPLGSDGGVAVTGDAGTLQCTADDPTDLCQACGAKSCCAEISACGDDCNKVIDCTSACDNGPPADSNACYDACAANNTEAGVNQFSALADCLTAKCDSECF